MILQRVKVLATLFAFSLSMVSLCAWSDDEFPTAPLGGQPTSDQSSDQNQNQNQPQDHLQDESAPISPDPGVDTAAKAPEVQADSSAETAPLAPVAPEPITESISKKIPKYQKLRPSVGVEIDGSLSAFNYAGGVPPPGQTTTAVPDIEALIEFEPPWIQAIGVLSVGVSMGNFPTSTDSQITATQFGIWSLGAQARYQARFFREQIVVPFAGYGIEAVSYKLAAASGLLQIRGPFVGAEILLNPFDKEGAFDFYNDSGVLRSYLVAEGRSYVGSDTNLDLAGSAFFFGLRIEY